MQSALTALCAHFFRFGLSTICRRALQEAVYQSTSEGHFNCVLIYDLHVAYGAGGIFRNITVFRARRYLLGLKGGLRATNCEQSGTRVGCNGKQVIYSASQADKHLPSS